ncbi:thioredoxin-like protein [Rhizophagus irregularis]|nr:thioredoxin-like protein [Rhizophagus irregularis]
MTIQITGYSISPFCLVLFHVLKELGLSYEFTQPGSFEEIKSPEYLATKHPFGKIPSLIDDGFQIYETRAIARYLVNKYQGKKNSTVLIPSDVQKAALVEQFISVEISYYTQPLGKLVGQLVFAKRRDLQLFHKLRNVRETLGETRFNRSAIYYVFPPKVECITRKRKPVLLSPKLYRDVSP